jgi:hypothetical protein
VESLKGGNKLRRNLSVYQGFNRFKKKHLHKITSILAFLLVCLVNPCLLNAENTKALQGVEFLTGFSQSKLHAKGNYQSIPLIVDFDFNLKPLVKKIGLDLPGLLQFQLEPFISPVYEPNANVEIGNAFAFKIGIFPDTWALQPYVKAAAGMVYMTQHTREQSTQFNFIEYGGTGIHYFFNKNTALTLEGRFRHLSNASIDHPNHGINSAFFLAGIAVLF